jgi:hypothetical protein
MASRKPSARLVQTNIERVRNRTEYAHMYRVSVPGMEDILVVMAASHLPQWLGAFETKLNKLFGSNPDRFNALLVSELPVVKGYKWHQYDLNGTQLIRGLYCVADGDMFANCGTLYLFSNGFSC